MERCSIPLDKAGLGTSLYFAMRTIGTFAGAILLVKIPGRKFLIVSIISGIVALAVMLVLSNLWGILIMISVLGLAVANVFPILFSIALQKVPEKANEISGLMIMGVVGGAIILPIMGVISDFTSQAGGLLVLFAALIYLFFSALKINS